MNIFMLRVGQCLGVLIAWHVLGSPVLGQTLRTTTAGDPGMSYTLTDILDLASARNPSLATFLANIESVQGETLTARAYPNPSFFLQGGRGEPRGADVSTQASGFEYQANVLQPVEWPLKRQSRIQAAAARLQTARLDADGFRLFLRAATKDAFYRVFLASKQAALAERNLQTVKDLRVSVDVRVRTGEAAAFEMVKAEVELLKAEKEVNRLRNQVELARAALNALLGNALPPSFSLLGEFELPQTLPELPILIDDALARHPTVDRQRREIDRKSVV